MHTHVRTPPYRPPSFAPSNSPLAPIQLPVNLSAAQLADELHAQLSRLAQGRDLRVLRRQARLDFRAVMRHARTRRLHGHHRAPLKIERNASAGHTATQRRRRRCR